MGVRMSSSCLIPSCHPPGSGLRGSSEGRTGPAEHGVLRVGKLERAAGALKMSAGGGDLGAGESEVTVGDLDLGAGDSSAGGDAEGVAAADIVQKGDLPYKRL
jgi:hypothetical protein